LISLLANTLLYQLDTAIHELYLSGFWLATCQRAVRGTDAPLCHERDVLAGSLPMGRRIFSSAANCWQQYCLSIVAPGSSHMGGGWIPGRAAIALCHINNLHRRLGLSVEHQLIMLVFYHFLRQRINAMSHRFSLPYFAHRLTDSLKPWRSCVVLCRR